MRKTLARAAIAALAAAIPLAVTIAPASAQTSYYFQNTNTGHYMETGGAQGAQVLMTATPSERATFVRIDCGHYYGRYVNDFYCEYQDVATFNCLKTDTGIRQQPVVEWPCASGSGSMTAQQELYSDPSAVSNFWMQNNGNNDVLIDSSNAVWDCDGQFCANSFWALVGT